MSETADTLIRHAMRAIGAYASGEVPTTQEYDDAFKTLKMMLRHWSANDIRLYYIRLDALTMTGSAVYSIGVGGDIDNGDAPTAIRGAYYSSGGVDYPLKIIDEAQYRRISQKTLSSTPEMLWYNPGYPLSYIYVYPTASGTLYLHSLTPLAEPALVTAQVVFPPEYDEAIIYGLAVRLAVEYGRDPSPLVIGLAKSALDALETKNFAAQVKAVTPEIIKISSPFNIDAC